MWIDPRGAWRGLLVGLLVIGATYVAFLLFAQFGFLAQLQHDLGDTGRVRAAMAAMGIAGLAASLGTAWLLGRVPGPRLVRIGLGAVAAVAAASLACHSFASLLAAAAATGASIGLLTVALAASLPEIVPVGSAGLCVGIATGAAYFLSNVPVLFEASPSVRALVPAGLAGVAMVFVRGSGRPHPRPGNARASQKEPPEGDSNRSPILGVGFTRRFSGSPGIDARAGVGRLLLTFLVLIWLDSAAFAVIQANPSLKAQTWGTEAQKLLQGGVHFVAAVGAGALLDASFGIPVPLAAWGLFAVAFPLLQSGGMGAGPIYAVGISFYSTALVVAPTWGGTNASPSPRWRAGLLYGVAGWLGSALGVGMAQDLGRIPGWFLGATGAVLALAWIPPARIRRLIRFGGPALALGAAGAAAVWIASERTEAAPLAQGSDAAVARGRLVYVQEGCIHCHSQYVRPGTRDEAWWGPFCPLDRSERPPLVGTRRQGPDLLQVGNRRSEVWHAAHLKDPRQLNPGSRMPSYVHLFAGEGRRGRDLVAYLASLGKATSAERWEMTQAEPAMPPPAAPSAVRGAHLFAAYCAVCHGAEGRGDGPLAATVSDPYANLRKPGGFRTRLPLASVIRHGLPPTSMPGHEWLTDQQIEDLAAYVRVAVRDCPCPSVSVHPEEPQ